MNKLHQRTLGIPQTICWRYLIGKLGLFQLYSYIVKVAMSCINWLRDLPERPTALFDSRVAIIHGGGFLVTGIASIGLTATTLLIPSNKEKEKKTFAIAACIVTVCHVTSWIGTRRNPTLNYIFLLSAKVYTAIAVTVIGFGAGVVLVQNVFNNRDTKGRISGIGSSNASVSLKGSGVEIGIQ